MLAVVNQKSTFFQLNSSIKETLTAIDRFEWQAIDELRQMQTLKHYEDAGHKNFEEYCESELCQWGGYRRIKQLLGAKKVVDLAGDLASVIRNERQARPLLRLVKQPDKLKEAIAIAIEENPHPSESDFAIAAKKVVPFKKSISRTGEFVKEPLVPFSPKVMISSQSPIRPNEEGECADGPNPDLKFVVFPDGTKELLRVEDLVAVDCQEPRVRSQESVTFTESELNDRITQAVEFALVGRKVELEEAALSSVKEQLEAARSHSAKLQEKNVQLQLEIGRLQALQTLENENIALRQEIEELKNALQRSATEDWGKPVFTNEAAKVINDKVVKVLEKFPPELHLRHLATTAPPNESLPEVLDLTGKVLQHLVPIGLAECRQSLQSARAWQDFDPVAQKWIGIKANIWQMLTQPERSRMKQLRDANVFQPALSTNIQVGDQVKVLEGKRKGQSLIVSTVDESGIWVRLSSERHACAGPFTPNQLESLQEVAICKN